MNLGAIRCNVIHFSSNNSTNFGGDELTSFLELALEMERV